MINGSDQNNQTSCLVDRYMIRSRYRSDNGRDECNRSDNGSDNRYGDRLDNRSGDGSDNGSDNRYGNILYKHYAASTCLIIIWVALLFACDYRCLFIIPGCRSSRGGEILWLPESCLITARVGRCVSCCLIYHIYYGSNGHVYHARWCLCSCRIEQYM